jgi:hypothetical protein
MDAARRRSAPIPRARGKASRSPRR